MAAEEQEHNKPLGTVWISRSHPALSAKLEEALRAEAHIHRGPSPPAGSTLSCIVCCTNGEEDIASEVRRLRALSEDAPVLVFSSQADLQLVREALQAGARGFIHAEMHPENIVFTVRLVSEGDIAFPIGDLAPKIPWYRPT